MKTTNFTRSAASTLLLSLLLAAAGTGCVTEVESGDGSDESALEGDDPGCELGATQECLVEGTDPSGQTTTYDGSQTCVEIDGAPAWDECQMSASSTPLVLSFDGGPVELVTTMAGAFDLTGLGATIATDWPAATTPWLALDRNGNGAIDGGEELFGSATRLSSGSRAENGFAALRELDEDGDGRITPRDGAWSRLVLWGDADADRASSPGELAPLSSRGIAAIELAYARDARCDARGNCEIERAGFTYSDGSATRVGAIIDVHLRWQQ